MQKYHKKHDKVHYINNNYVLKPIYNDENECINDLLSHDDRERELRVGMISKLLH